MNCLICSKKSTKSCDKCNKNYCNNCYDVHTCQRMNPDMDPFVSRKKVIEEISSSSLFNEPVIRKIMNDEDELSNEGGAVKSRPLDVLLFWILGPGYGEKVHTSKMEPLKHLEKTVEKYMNNLSNKQSGQTYAVEKIEGFDYILNYIKSNPEVLEYLKNSKLQILNVITENLNRQGYPNKDVFGLYPVSVPPVIPPPVIIETMPKPQTILPTPQMKSEELKGDKDEHSSEGGVKFLREEIVTNSDGRTSKIKVCEVETKKYIIENGAKKLVNTTETIYTRPHFRTRGTFTQEKVELVYYKKIANIYNILKRVFAFPDSLTQKLFMSAFLVKDGSMYLQGIPGSGKTTLIEISTMLMSNNIDYSKSGAKCLKDENGKYIKDENGNYIFNPYTGYTTLSQDRFNKSKYGTLAIVKCNPDKLPTEVLYKTEIMINRHITTPDGKAVITNPRKIILKNPNTNEPVEYQIYDFKPESRPIVDAGIKLFNEINRANSATQDAILGLLAEKQVEYMGSIFYSPKEGAGAVTFLDSNPHIDILNRGELDMAFNDRIDLSLWFPTPNLSGRFNIGVLIEKTGKDIREIVSQLLNIGGSDVETRERGIEPISFDELQEIWEDVNAIKIPQDLQYIIALYTSIFGATKKVYNKFYSDSITIEKWNKMVITDEIIKGMDAINKPLINLTKKENLMSGTLVDKSLMKYPTSIGTQINRLDSQLDMSSTGTIPKYDKMLEEIVFPLGDRIRQSCIKFLKAYCWLQKSILVLRAEKNKLKGLTKIKLKNNDELNVDEILKNKTVIEPTLQDFIDILPYALDHRIGLNGVNAFNNILGQKTDTDISKYYLSFNHFVKYHLCPNYLAEKNVVEKVNGLIKHVINISKKQKEYNLTVEQCFIAYLMGGEMKVVDRNKKVQTVDFDKGAMEIVGAKNQPEKYTEQLSEDILTALCHELAKDVFSQNISM